MEEWAPRAVLLRDPGCQVVTPSRRRGHQGAGCRRRLWNPAGGSPVDDGRRRAAWRDLCKKRMAEERAPAEDSFGRAMLLPSQ